MEEFNNLARYAPNDVNTDAARKEKFLEGLNDDLSLQLTVDTFNNCQELIDKVIAGGKATGHRESQEEVQHQ